jgi:hypothetical protein
MGLATKLVLPLAVLCLVAGASTAGAQQQPRTPAETPDAIAAPSLLVEEGPPDAAAQVPTGTPAQANREVLLGNLTGAAAGEVHDLVVNRAVLEMGYEVSGTAPPYDVPNTTDLAVLEGAGERRGNLLAVGLASYSTQAPRLYLVGSTGPDATVQAAGDVDALAELADTAARETLERTFSVRELSHEVYQLSCIDPDNGLAALAALGYSVGPPSDGLTLAQLPRVFKIEYATPGSLVGGGTAIDAKTLTEETLSVEENRLVLLYHSTQSQEVGRLKDVLAGTVDVPADQVLIEGMVIEIGERDYRELGMDWAYHREGWYRVAFGEEGSEVPFLLTYDPTLEVAEGLRRRLTGTIRMLLEEGKGEILSSPSVLVLNNRNAKFQVVREVPVFKTVITETTSKVEVEFKTAGIILNIKPRIDRDGAVVAMQVLVEVSEAPEEDFIVVQDQAIAPIINRRIVETVARVHDGTPFIIGGLIRNERAREENRVPVLSRIPILGVFFRSRTARREKREVIIVLTPRVIRVGGSNRPVLPKDTERFDFLDNRLFRNSYRLRADDVLDFGFLLGNSAIRDAMEEARRLVRRHPDLAKRSPFTELAEGVIPGEEAVVVRMLFEVVRDKLKLHEQVTCSNLIFFREDASQPAGFRVWFIDNPGGRGLLQEASPDGTVKGFFARPYPRDALLLRFDLDPDGGPDAALRSQVAHVEFLRVQRPGDVSLRQRLLEVNSLGDDYRHDQFALAIDSESDLVRLQAAVALREIANVNDFGPSVRLSDFQVGRRIVIPEFVGARDRMFLVDHRVAEIFFKSDYYYESLKERLERGHAIVREALAAEEGR